jgi:hypothetical protein
LAPRRKAEERVKELLCSGGVLTAALEFQGLQR